MVDDRDFIALSAHKWYAHKNRDKGFYAGRTIYYADGRRKTVKMARIILGVTDPNIVVDHRNRFTLDNQRKNLRATSVLHNNRNLNGARRDSTTGKRGVSPRGRRFMVRIVINWRRKSLGTYATSAEASRVFAEASKQHYGAFRGTHV